ncbi:thermonuclease family protein [Yersinia rohdei]|jgi:micrococcal nuclease|uniref:thermonuclease family protein n=1 Tax=Yersiniaceae TaxID=1903411 RepID=UPI0025AAAC4E|nr:thermonuclease family protein [Yersinia rohdei]EIN3662836.1 thermonuclease family protein [Salmonella enterica]EJH2158547.1 thermonuclease family protein [Salmonella enterica]EKC5142214.1 thermonuclease family protein [Salmonella enterica]MDN0096667.1 thermonuclease family protein [Yersinia rohdei]
MKKINSCLFAILISLSNYALANISGEVIRIIDGDTVEVLVNKKPLRIRLADIDAPESKQPFGQRSRQSLADLIFRHQVVIADKGTDRYNRTLGTIYTTGNFNVNAEQVRRGMAWAYRYHERPTNAAMLTLEIEAKAARRGLWGDSSAIEPWKWRKLRAHETEIDH